MVAITPNSEQHQRSSPAWDSSKRPCRGILKKPARPKFPSHPRIQELHVPLESDEEDSGIYPIPPLERIEINSDGSSQGSSGQPSDGQPGTPSLADMLSSLAIADEGSSNNTEKENVTDACANDGSLDTGLSSVVAGNHYRVLGFEQDYDEPSLFTMRYGLTRDKLDKMISGAVPISFCDVYVIWEMLSFVKRELKANPEAPQASFYGDSYWLFKYVETVVTQLSIKFGIDKFPLAIISFAQNPEMSQFVFMDRRQQTHIIRDHLNLCDWASSTLGTNFKERRIPYEFVRIFHQALVKLSEYMASQPNPANIPADKPELALCWLDYACNQFA